MSFTVKFARLAVKEEPGTLSYMGNRWVESQGCTWSTLPFAQGHLHKAMQIAPPEYTMGRIYNQAGKVVEILDNRRPLRRAS